jgi:hypothetical protein
MLTKLYTIAVTIISNPWLWGVLGWTLVLLDYPYGNVLPVYAE